MKTFILSDGSVAGLGENGQENWNLISSQKIDPKFYWFHLSSFPSGHLVLFASELSPEIAQECYELCRAHSKYKKDKNLKVDCTQIKNLRKTERVGEVEYKCLRKVRALRY